MIENDIVWPPIHLPEFAIAYRHGLGYWPKRFEQTLFDACAKHNCGTHEMTQGRQDGWVIQYLIPRKNPAEPRKVFDLSTAAWSQRLWAREKVLSD